MADWIQPVSALLFLLVYLCESSVDFVSECTLKGFTDNLLCSTCEKMDGFNLGQIKLDCLECCHKDQEDNNGKTKYPFAELVVCG